LKEALSKLPKSDISLKSFKQEDVASYKTSGSIAAQKCKALGPICTQLRIAASKRFKAYTEYLTESKQSEKLSSLSSIAEISALLKVKPSEKFSALFTTF
jgi:hypothetical protein